MNKKITVFHFGLPLVAEFRDSDSATMRCIPVGALSVATVLKEKDYTVSFRDYQLACLSSPLEVKNIAAFLEDPADILCIGCTSNFLALLLLAIKIIKKRYPKKIIILGGPGPTDVYDTILDDFPFVDFVVRGEGELTVAELIRTLQEPHKSQKLRGIMGVSYRDKEGRITHNPDRELIEDLDNLPELDLSLLEGGYNIVYSLTARGCPYDCVYCNNVGFWRRKVRFRSLKRIFEEIRKCRERFKNIQIAIGDDTFGLDRERITEFCRYYDNEGLDFIWGATHRIDLFDEATIKKMSEINLGSVLFGIESGSNRILKMLNRNYTIQQAIEVVSRSLRYAPSVAVTFMYGYPFETITDLLNTLEAINLFRHPRIFTRLNLLSPLKQSSLYRDYSQRLVFPKITSSAVNFSANFQVKDRMVNTRYMPDLASNKTDTGQLQALIKRYPETFLSYYLYDSDIGLKEGIVKEFMNFLRHRERKRESIVEIGGNLIYFGQAKVRLLKPSAKPRSVSPA